MDMKKTLSGNVDNPVKHAAGLSAVWQKCMLELYKSDCRSLVGREHGQLGKLKKSLGIKQATEIVEYAIRNWGKFAQKAAKNVESDIVPPKPGVGWLYQYHATALLMLHEELQSQKQAEQEQANKEAPAKEEAKAVVQIATKAVHEVEHKPATLEELEAIAAEVDAEWAAKEKLSA